MIAIDPMKKSKNRKSHTNKALITFLRKTKEGKYASIETSSLPYSRIETESISSGINEDLYFYSLR